MAYDFFFLLWPTPKAKFQTKDYVRRQQSEVKMAKNNKTETSKTPKLVPSNKSSAPAAPVRNETAIPRPPQPVSDPDSFERLNELIRLRAYELYDKRGRGEGLGLEEQDWLQAEQEVMEQYRKRTA